MGSVHHCGKAGTNLPPPFSSSDTPGAPYKLEASDIAKDSVTLAWYEPDEDGGSPITGYWVERHEPDHDKWIRCNKLPIKDTNYRWGHPLSAASKAFRLPRCVPVC